MNLQDKIIWTPLDKTKQDILNFHLQAISQVLKAESTNYTIRQMYHLFQKDVEAFMEEKDLQAEPFYLSLIS